MKKVIYTPKAKEDLLRIKEGIIENFGDEELAVRSMRKLTDRVKLLPDFPNMGAVVNIEVRSYVAEMEENNANVRKMVLDSYQDMKDGKGRDYKEFFAELESRYKNANV